MTQERYKLLVKHCNGLSAGDGCYHSPKKYSIGCPQHRTIEGNDYTIDCPLYHQALRMSGGKKCMTRHSKCLAKKWLKKMAVIQEIMS